MTVRITRVEIFNNGNGKPDRTFTPNCLIPEDKLDWCRKRLEHLHSIKIDTEEAKIEVSRHYKYLSK
jgi:uncharacterized protein YcaQ